MKIRLLAFVLFGVAALCAQQQEKPLVFAGKYSPASLATLGVPTVPTSTAVLQVNVFRLSSTTPAVRITVKYEQDGIVRSQARTVETGRASGYSFAMLGLDVPDTDLRVLSVLVEELAVRTSHEY